MDNLKSPCEFERIKKLDNVIPGKKLPPDVSPEEIDAYWEAEREAVKRCVNLEYINGIAWIAHHINDEKLPKVTLISVISLLMSLVAVFLAVSG